MKNTTKILVGVGAVALAYYLFKDKVKSIGKIDGGGDNNTNSTYQSNNGGVVSIPKNEPKFTEVPSQSTPTSGGATTMECKYQYRLLTDHKHSGMNGSIGQPINLLFKKGTIIQALPNPYAKGYEASNSLYTTPNGTKPVFNFGSVSIPIPTSHLQKVGGC